MWIKFHSSSLVELRPISECIFDDPRIRLGLDPETISLSKRTFQALVASFSFSGLAIGTKSVQSRQDCSPLPNGPFDHLRLFKCGRTAVYYQTYILYEPRIRLSLVLNTILSSSIGLKLL